MERFYNVGGPACWSRGCPFCTSRASSLNDSGSRTMQDVWSVLFKEFQYKDGRRVSISADPAWPYTPLSGKLRAIQRCFDDGQALQTALDKLLVSPGCPVIFHNEPSLHGQSADRAEPDWRGSRCVPTTKTTISYFVATMDKELYWEMTIVWIHPLHVIFLTCLVQYTAVRSQNADFFTSRLILPFGFAEKYTSF